jgi:ADP-ribose pyrophosphatase
MPSSLQPWQILSSTVIHQTPWIEVIAEECSANGQQFTYTFVHRRDEGPQIIALTAEKKIWLVQQYRHPIRQILWQLPAEGKLAGETWEDAAARGLQEELGLQAEKLLDLGRFFVDPGLLQQQTHFFLATELSSIGSPIEKAHTSEQEVEELRVEAFSLGQIDQMISDGQICDNWTLAGLFMVQRYLRSQS